MDFSKKQLNASFDKMLNMAFQSVMVGILSQNVKYRQEMNDLYMVKKDDLYKISSEYWESLKNLNKKYKESNFLLFNDFFSGGFDIMKDYFEMWTQSKTTNSQKITEDISKFTSVFMETNKESESYCKEAFVLLKDTLEKINNTVEEFKKNAEVVIEKYSQKPEQAKS